MSDTLPLPEAREPARIPRSEHCISRKNISGHALKVLYRLHEAGYRALLVGGAVRDLLLGMRPKDFDIATDATPEQVKALFRNCRLIGRRFRLAHILFGREYIEVATFRADQTDHDDRVVDENGRIVRDNVYGTLEEDVIRRDFSINALYYDIDDYSVVDYVGGVRDLHAGVIRLIGDPTQRYQEDPVRMLRALRFKAKLGFQIDEASERPIAELGRQLAEIPSARLFEEVLKLFQSGHAVASLAALREYDLLKYLFPPADACLKSGDVVTARLIDHGLRNTDQRVAEDKPITPAFLYAVFLWPAVRDRADALEQAGEPPVPALQQASVEVLPQQLSATALPKRFSVPMQEIWAMQPKLANYTGKRALRLLEHPRFRAGYDFLLLRAQAGEGLEDLATWWTEIQNKPDEERQTMARRQQVRSSESGRRRRRRRSRQRKPGAAASLDAG